MSQTTPNLATNRIRCKRCGEEYVVATGYPARAPHGPNRDWPSDAWEPVEEATDAA
jgi:ribosomal protein L37E